VTKIPKAAAPSDRHTRRWPATLAVIAALGLQLAVPTQVLDAPRWIMPAVAGALLIPLVWTNPFHLERDEIWLRWLELALLSVLVLINAIYLTGLIVLLTGGDTSDGKVLVKGALLIWVTNVVAFALWYWEVDRGGPFARMPEHEHEEERPDLLFPQMTADIPGWERWVPGFTDYLFVAFTAATAFSPTDTMPLTARLKTLMAIQSAISLLTIAVVAARAVNVL
jgi:hypothetical protein